jgi:hypothetical protein
VEIIPTTPTIPTKATMAVDIPIAMAIMVHLSDLVATTHTVTHPDHHPLLIHPKCLDHLLQVHHWVDTDLLQVLHLLLQAHLLQVLLLPVLHRDCHQDLHQVRHLAPHLVRHRELAALVYHPVNVSPASPT